MIWRMKAVLLVVSMMACGCGSSEKMTKGEFCDELTDQICQRFVECDLDGYDACFQERKRSCCIEDGTCSENHETRTNAELESYIEQCSVGIQEHECSLIPEGVIPAECLQEP